MRALRIHAHGGPEVMRIEDTPIPVPTEGERLVRLAAASVNPVDWKIREGLYPMPLPRTLGRDGAGIDEATGERILGVASPGRDGTHAEYAVFARTASAKVPEGTDIDEAAVLGIAGLSAWIALGENADVRAGQRVLIHAGAGGVGSLAIQIARQRGAEVWTTCSARNAGYCRELGAHRVIDYRQEDFAASGPIFDVVFDTVGGAVHRRSAAALKRDGALAYLNAEPLEPAGRSDIRVLPTEVRATTARLETLLGLGLRVSISGRYPIERAAEAYELSRSGRVRGKLLLEMTGGA